MGVHAALIVAALLHTAVAQGCTNRRPPVGQRSFVSPAVDASVDDLADRINDTDLACLFRNTAPNTLDTTVQYIAQENSSFVITGDIKAMWLRDSTNQVLPYVRLASSEPTLASSECYVLTPDLCLACHSFMLLVRGWFKPPWIEIRVRSARWGRSTSSLTDPI